MAQEFDPFYLLTAAQPGTSDEFQALTGPYQRELLLHCYRILGSLDDAEDALQETLLRAWRRLDTLKEPASLRAWLYKIATNASLDMLSNRKARGLASAFYAPADPAAALREAVVDPIWLEPLPDEFLVGRLPGPEALVEAHESVSLAFLAALQQLPGRQRAALILRDVLDWSAQETADMLGLSLAAANSALQRARATLKKNQAGLIKTSVRPTHDPQASQLLTRYMQAWEAADAPGLAALLREDAILTMPPLPAWYLGRADIQAFFERHLFTEGAAGRFRTLITHANASPALAVYQQAGGEDQPFRPASLQVLSLEDEQITRIDCFLTSSEDLFARFGLPVSL